MSDEPSNVWPFVLLLPKDPVAQRLTLTSAFGSDLAVELLRMLRLDGRTYQRDFIKRLTGYSTKSIIKYLRAFVNVGILNEGMERAIVEGRTAWLKWYEPTLVGRWLILLLTPRDELPPNQVERIVKELLGFYARSAIKLCTRYNIDVSYFEGLLKEALKSSA